MKYDVFISYRREGGGEFARTIKAELEAKGYSVFLDFDELKDGIFDERILMAIESAPVFLFILSNHSLDRCSTEGDWVRKEVEYAHSLGRHIIPINKDGVFEGLPEDLPPVLAEVFTRNQYSEVMVGQLFGASVQKMINERISPVVRPARIRMTSRVVIVSVAVILCLVSLFSFSRRADAHRAAEEYASCISLADSLMYCEDSLNAVQNYLDAALSLSDRYEGTHYNKLFNTDAAGMRTRLDHVKDSFFVKNRNYVEFYIARYRENRSADDKKMTLYYIDKALAIRNDADLAAMRRILQ